MGWKNPEAFRLPGWSSWASPNTVHWVRSTNGVVFVEEVSYDFSMAWCLLGVVGKNAPLLLTPSASSSGWWNELESLQSGCCCWWCGDGDDGEPEVVACGGTSVGFCFVSLDVCSQWEEERRLCKLGELTVLCCFREGENLGLVGLLRRVDSCLKRVKLEPSPAGTKGTWQPEDSE